MSTQHAKALARANRQLATMDAATGAERAKVIEKIDRLLRGKRIRLTVLVGRLEELAVAAFHRRWLHSVEGSSVGLLPPLGG